MKINESIINDKAFVLINETASCVWEVNDSKSKLTANLAYINGVCEFANELKNLLKKEDDVDDE